MGDKVFLRTNGLIGGSAADAHVDTFLRMNTHLTNTLTLRRQRIRTLTPNELRVAHGGSYTFLGAGRTGYPRPPASYGHRRH